MIGLHIGYKVLTYVPKQVKTAKSFIVVKHNTHTAALQLTDLPLNLQVLSMSTCVLLRQTTKGLI